MSSPIDKDMHRSAKKEPFQADEGPSSAQNDDLWTPTLPTILDSAANTAVAAEFPDSLTAECVISDAERKEDGSTTENCSTTNP